MIERFTPLDEIVNYKSKAVSLIRSNQKVMEFISDKPNINLNSDDAITWEEHIKDYYFLEGTTSTAGAWIMIDIVVPRVENSIKDLLLYINISCSKDYVDLSDSKLKGNKGNRIDNLVRYIDSIFNSENVFGIGKLKLDSVSFAAVPDPYTAKLLTYRPIAFSARG